MSTTLRLTRAMERCRDKIYCIGGPTFEEEWDGIYRALNIDAIQQVRQLQVNGVSDEDFPYRASDAIIHSACVKSGAKFFKRKYNGKQI